MRWYLTARLAQHEDGWNGQICSAPKKNKFITPAIFNVGCYEANETKFKAAHGGQQAPFLTFLSGLHYVP